MKKLVYITLIIAILFAVSFFAKDKTTPPMPYNTIETTEEDVIDVIETSPEITGDEQETIIKE